MPSRVSVSNLPRRKSNLDGAEAQIRSLFYNMRREKAERLAARFVKPRLTKKERINWDKTRKRILRLAETGKLGKGVRKIKKSRSAKRGSAKRGSAKRGSAKRRKIPFYNKTRKY